MTARERESRKHRRAEERVVLLEPGDQIELTRRDRPGCLGVLGNRAARLLLQRRLPPVQHQDGVEPGRVQRGRYPPRDCHFLDFRMTLHRHIIVQANPHENGGVPEHPRDVRAVSEAIAIVVIATVVDEERVVAVREKAAPGVCRRDRSGFAAVAGEAGPAIAAEGLDFEESLTLEEFAQCFGLRWYLPGDEAGCCNGTSGVPARRYGDLAAGLPPASSWRYRRGMGAHDARREHGSRGQAEHADDDEFQSMHGESPDVGANARTNARRGRAHEALRVRIFAGCAETIRPARGFAAGILAAYCTWPRARSSIGPAQTAVAIG